ncbi:MAG: hypothetical protein ACI971_000944 [Colwellia sp.]|jgi:hypothetical protein
MKLLPFIAIYLSAFTVLADDNIYQQVTLKGKWLVETDQQVMFDPQTSALKLWRDKLLTLSDGSADKSQQKQLHIIEPTSGLVEEKSLFMTMSSQVKSSCFSSYLAGEPDFEALAVDPNNDKIFIIVTEDARNSDKLSSVCQQRFQNTGSTTYPTLIVRLALDDNNILSMTHVRPLQFDASYNVGDFSNDGIEGLAFGQDNTLYLGLEKDSKGLARIFSLVLDENFWATDEFAPVVDTEVLLPTFSQGMHPINGMDYLSKDNHPGYIVAAARNDDQLWIIDLAKKQPTKVIAMNFLAPVSIKNNECSDWEPIDNTSLEGVAVANNNIWLINDPWKAHYIENAKCPSNYDKYKTFSPLLFSLAIDKGWLE